MDQFESARDLGRIDHSCVRDELESKRVINPGAALSVLSMRASASLISSETVDKKTLNIKLMSTVVSEKIWPCRSTLTIASHRS